MSAPIPTGRRLDEGGRTYVELVRTFRAPAADVWAAVTEPERLARWIGTWTGDPATGSVLFTMTFEGEDPQGETFHIDECTPPHRLRITTALPKDDGTAESWRLRLDLEEAGGVTTLRFAQDLPDPATAENVGPGWEYYLDRLVATETGADPATVAWDDYYPSLAEHYMRTFS